MLSNTQMLTLPSLVTGSRLSESAFRTSVTEPPEGPLVVAVWAPVVGLPVGVAFSLIVNAWVGVGVVLDPAEADEVEDDEAEDDDDDDEDVELLALPQAAKIAETAGAPTPSAAARLTKSRRL